MNQAATDAKQRPAFKAGTQEPVATPLRGVFPWPSLLTMPLHYSALDVER